MEGQHKTIKVDGKGPNSFPLDLRIINVQSPSLSDDIQSEVCQIIRPESNPPSQRTYLPGIIAILESKCFSSIDFEKWVMEYINDSKLDNLCSTSFSFGVAYARERLPHVSSTI